MARPGGALGKRVLTDCDAVASAERAGDDTRRWLRQQGGRMKRQLLGMALVVPAMQFTRGFGLDLERLLEVPAQVFTDIDAVMEWSIAPPHCQSWGRAAIRARLGMV